MFLLVPAHPGCPGQFPQSRKTGVCVCGQSYSPDGANNTRTGESLWNTCRNLVFFALLTRCLGVCRVHEEINHLIDKLHMEQNCQLGLIHGSQIDWSADPELCKLVSELGQPVVQRVN